MTVNVGNISLDGNLAIDAESKLVDIDIRIKAMES